MKFLLAIVRKELIGHLWSFRFMVATAIMGFLAVLATVVGVTDFNQRLASYRQQVEQYRQANEEVVVYSFLQPVVVRPPEPLSVLDRGFDGRLGNLVRINVFSIPVRATGGGQGNPFMTTLRSLDVTTMVRVVLGLLALLLTFDGMIGLRESGNLRLLLAHGLPPMVLVAGTFLGALGAVLLALFLGFGASVVVFVARLDVALDASHWGRIAGLVGVWGLYLVFMLLLGLLISAVARSAAASLRLSILIWLVIVFLLPQAVLRTVGSLAHTGLDRQRTEDQVADLLSERDGNLEKLWQSEPLRRDPSGHFAPVYQTELNRAELRRYGSAAFYDSVAAYHRAEVATGRDSAERIFALAQAYDRQVRRIETLAIALASLSPAFLAERVSESLAGTSIADQEAFLAASRDYRRRLIDYLEERDAFAGWQWFTDEIEPRPWSTLFDKRPEEIDDGNVSEFIEKFLKLDSREPEPARRGLEVEDLPEFRPGRLTAGRALERMTTTILGLFLVNGVLAAALVWRARSTLMPAASGRR